MTPTASTSPERALTATSRHEFEVEVRQREPERRGCRLHPFTPAVTAPAMK